MVESKTINLFPKQINSQQQKVLYGPWKLFTCFQWCSRMISFPAVSTFLEGNLKKEHFKGLTVIINLAVHESSGNCHRRGISVDRLKRYTDELNSESGFRWADEFGEQSSSEKIWGYFSASKLIKTWFILQVINTKWLVKDKQSNVINFIQVCERKSESKFISMQEFIQNSAAHVVSSI